MTYKMARDARRRTMGARLSRSKSCMASASLYIAEQLGSAAVLNNVDGVELMKAIASRLDHIKRAGPAS